MTRLMYIYSKIIHWTWLLISFRSTITIFLAYVHSGARSKRTTKPNTKVFPIWLADGVDKCRETMLSFCYTSKNVAITVESKATFTTKGLLIANLLTYSAWPKTTSMPKNSNQNSLANMRQTIFRPVKEWPAYFGAHNSGI